MNTPIAVRIECAKGEILNAMETIQKRHALPPCIMDGVLSSVLAEVRSEAKIELINSTNTMMTEKNEELDSQNFKESNRFFLPILIWKNFSVFFNGIIIYRPSSVVNSIPYFR